MYYVKIILCINRLHFILDFLVFPTYSFKVPGYSSLLSLFDDVIQLMTFCTYMVRKTYNFVG